MSLRSLAAITVIAAIVMTAAVTGCGSSNAKGRTDAFNACIGKSDETLSASGQPVVNGAVEPIVDQLHGIVGNVWLYRSQTEAEANARVMTGYPVQIVRGPYMVNVNPNTTTHDSLAIQTCASKLPGKHRGGAAEGSSSSQQSRFHPPRA